MHVRMQRSERREEVLFRHSGQLALGEGIRVEGTGQMSCAVTQSPSFLIPHLSSPFSSVQGSSRELCGNRVDSMNSCSDFLGHQSRLL